MDAAGAVACCRKPFHDMHDTVHGSLRADRAASGAGFFFHPVRADRAALGARRDEIPPAAGGSLILCRQAAGACEFRAGNAEGRLIAGDMVMVEAASGMLFTGDVATVERLTLPRCRLSAPAEVVAAAHGRVIAARSPFGTVLGCLLDAVRAPDGLLAEAEPFGEVLMRALFSAVALAAVEGMDREDEESPLVDAIYRHIEANLGDPTLSPDTIGRQFGLSRAALYRLWRRFGGVAEHVRKRRLARAQLYLSTAQDAHASIAEIAHRCGFRSVGSFSRVYRQRYGCTPNGTIIEAARTRIVVGQP